VDSDKGPHQDIRGLVWEVAEARERYSASMLEVSRLRAFNTDLESTLTTLSETAAKAQGEAAEARAKAEDLERDLTAARRAIADMGLHFDDLESRLHALEHAALCTVNMARVPGSEVVFRLHDLPSHVWRVVSLGAHRGAALALTVVQLRSGQDLRQLNPELSPLTTMEERNLLAGDFGLNATHVIAEIDNAEILRQAGGGGC